MNKKQQFMNAVQTLAANDQFMFEAAQRIPEEELTTCPGAAALEFVAGLSRLMDRLEDEQPNHLRAWSKKPRQQEGHQKGPCIIVKANGENLVEKAVPIRCPITLGHALRVKSAETWLEFGQPDEALRELEKLPRKSWGHPWAARVRVAALEMLRELNGQAHAE